MKRREELHGLSDDHHTALVVAFRCRRAGAGQGDLSAEEAWRQALRLASNQLVNHFRVEEEILLPALEELGEGEMARRIAAEHRQLEDLLTVEEAAADAVTAFGELLDQHIRFEERVVFEQTQDRLPRSVLDAIALAAPHDRACKL